MKQLLVIATCSALICALARPSVIVAGPIQSQSATVVHTYRKTFAHEVINTIPVDASKVLPLLPDEYDFVPAAAVGLGSADQALVVIGNFQGSNPQIDDQEPGTDDQVAIDLLVLVQQPALAAAAGLDIPGAFHVYTIAIYTNDAPYAASLEEADFPVELVPELVYDRQIDDDTGIGELTVEVPASDSPFYSFNTANGYAPSGPLNTVFWYNGEHGTAVLQFIDDPTDLGQTLSLIYTEPGSSLNELLDGGGLGPGPTDPVTGFESVTAPSLNYRYHDVSFGRLMLFVPEPSTFFLALGLLGLPIRLRRQVPKIQSFSRYDEISQSEPRSRGGFNIIRSALRALCLCVITFLTMAFVGPAKADIYQWEYIDPADPSQGKRQSTTLAPDGAGVDAVPGADLSNRNLTMAYLIGAQLRDVRTYSNLSGTNLSRADLTNADIIGARFTNADFTDAEVRGAGLGQIWRHFFDERGSILIGTGITLSQLYSTASYQGLDLSGIGLQNNDLTRGNFTEQDLTGASFLGAALSGADFTNAQIRDASFGKSPYVVPSYAGAQLFGTGITLDQLYSTANYQAHDLSGIHFGSNSFSGGDFTNQDLRGTSFDGATLTGADFTGADIRGSRFGLVQLGLGNPALSGSGISPAQIYSTASYRTRDLSGISLNYCYLTGANLTGANLANSSFEGALLTAADFTGADLSRANFTGAELQSASLAGANLFGATFNVESFSGVPYYFADLTGANLQQANLTNARFENATLTDANFSGAEVRGATFATQYYYPDGRELTSTQLYSTASYQAGDLTGIRFFYNNLTGWNLAGQNLTNASFWQSILTGADFSQADARGAEFYQSGATTTNFIWPDGHIDGLDLQEGVLLVVHDYDGNPAAIPEPTGPIPISIDQHLTMAPGGTLQMVFEADPWDSTVSFAPGIPVTLGGTLELTFADNVNLASQRGRTFDLFDWDGVTPIGTFEVSSPYEWDYSNLYTTGEVMLTAVPEPTSLVLFLFGVMLFLPFPSQ